MSAIDIGGIAPFGLRARIAEALAGLVYWAVTHVTALRSAIADLVDTTINTGAGTAVLKLRDGTTDIVTFNLANPAFGAAASGIITLAGVPISAVAATSGDVDNFQILDRDGTVTLSGSVTATGGGGDIEVSNISVASAQDCDLESLTYAASA